MNNTPRLEVPYYRSILSAIESLRESLLSNEEVREIVGLSLAYRILLESTIIPMQHCETVTQRLREIIAEIERLRTGSDIKQVVRNLQDGCNAVEQQKRVYNNAVHI